MSQGKLTPEQVRHEREESVDKYFDAEMILRSSHEAELAAISAKCPHDNTRQAQSGKEWCVDCQYMSEKRA